MSLPEGTVTFLRSDIEGSMEHARALGARYDELNAEHAALVRAAVETHGGQVVRTEGDAFFVVFTDAVRSTDRTCPARIGSPEGYARGEEVLIDLERGYDPFGNWHEYKSEQEIMSMFKDTHTIRDVLRQARGTISLPSGAYVLSFEETD